jgi:hypothetical protein
MEKLKRRRQIKGITSKITALRALLRGFYGPSDIVTFHSHTPEGALG